MCDKCNERNKKLLAQVELLSELVKSVLVEHDACNEAVFLLSAQFLMSAVKALDMPPEVFTNMMCSLYSNATGSMIIPVGMTKVDLNHEDPPNDSKEPKDKPN